MTAIPAVLSPTMRAIADTITASRDDYESVGIAAGDIGTECERELWLKFRRASVPETIDWHKARIFERGNIEEERLLALLESIGCTVTEQQARVRDCGGHLRGKIDAQATGIPCAPVTEHLVECKSANGKSFKEMVAKGVQKANPKHYATIQFYMHKRGLSRSLYMVSCKDTEALHLERINYDVAFALRAIARVSRVIGMDTPPARLCTKRDDFRGSFCKQAAVCWGEEMPRGHCRTCIHSTAQLDGNAGWDCARFNKPLSLEEQAAGCPAHLYLPPLVPGEQIECDEENETITYRMANGTIWVDGGNNGD